MISGAGRFRPLEDDDNRSEEERQTADECLGRWQFQRHKQPVNCDTCREQYNDNAHQFDEQCKQRREERREERVEHSREEPGN